MTEAVITTRAQGASTSRFLAPRPAEALNIAGRDLRACCASVLSNHDNGCVSVRFPTSIPNAGRNTLRTGVTSAMMQRRAIRTRTCPVSNDPSHNHNGNNGGHHAASTPFPTPRVIWVSHYGVLVCHGKPPCHSIDLCKQKRGPQPQPHCNKLLPCWLLTSFGRYARAKANIIAVAPRTNSMFAVAPIVKA